MEIMGAHFLSSGRRCGYAILMQNDTSSPANAPHANHNHFRFHRAHDHLAPVFGNDWFALKAEAFARLILWMEADYGWNRWRAYDLLTHVARISVGYFALGTVAMKLNRLALG